MTLENDRLWVCLINFGTAIFSFQVKEVGKLEDLTLDKQDPPIFHQHADYVNQTGYSRTEPYAQTEPNQMIVDCIASMADDYLIDLHRCLFPDSTHYVECTGYFNDLYALRNRLKGQLSMEDDD